MSEIWMDVDIALASVPVNSIALVDAGDFKTIEDAVAFDQAGMALFWNFTTTAGVKTVTAVTPTAAGDYDWTDFATSGMYGIEIPASGGASINNDAEGFGYFTGVATGVLPWRGPTIGFRAAALNNALIDGGDQLDVNVLQISGDGPAADNLELMYDGTGYTGVGAPSSREQVDGIGAASGGSLNIEATEDNTGGAIIDSVTFVGSVQGATTFSNTEAEDGVFHDIDDTTNDIDIVYGFSVGGGRTGVEIIFAGFVQGNGDEMKIKVFDHVGSDWEIIGTIPGQNGTANITLVLPLLLKHTGTGSEIGKVYIRFETDATTPSNLSVDKLLVSAVNIGQSVGYALGRIWINTALSNTNTEPFVDGTADNPVSTIAAAVTLSTSTGLTDFGVINGSSITLMANSDNHSFFGNNWTLAVGGQSLVAVYVTGATISGVYTGLGAKFVDCEIGTMTCDDDAHFIECAFAGTLTLVAGDIFLDNCHDANGAVADFAAAGATTLHVHGYRGELEVQNMAAGDVVEIGGSGAFISNANNAAGTINIRGAWDVTNNGSATIVLDDNQTGVDAILVDTANMQPKLGTPAGADMSTDIAAVKADTVLPEKNQAFANIPVLMVDSTDHVTPKTGLSVTVQRSLDGAAYGNATGSIAEVSNGTYQFDASAADMNADSIMFKFSGTAADDVFLTVFTR